MGFPDDVHVLHVAEAVQRHVGQLLAAVVQQLRDPAKEL